MIIDKGLLIIGEADIESARLVGQYVNVVLVHMCIVA